MSEPSEAPADNVVTLGGGGRIYRDSRKENGQRDPEVPPLPDPKRKQPARPASVVTTVQPPPEPKPPFDWRGFFTTLIELLGVLSLTAAGFTVNVTAGLIVFGIFALAIGVAVEMKSKK